MPRFLFLLLLLITPALRAATVRAYVDPERAAVGQTVIYVIEVRNAASIQPPQLTLQPQLGQNSALEHQRAIQVDGNTGQRSVVDTFTWQIGGNVPDEYTIQAHDVFVDGDVVKTNPVRLIITDAPTPSQQDEQTTPLLQLEVGKTEMYQGEVVPLKATLLVPRSLNVQSFGLINVEKNDVAVSRFPHGAVPSQTVIGDVGYMAYSYQTTLSPMKAGQLRAGPATMEVIFQLMQDPRGMPGMRLPPGFAQMFAMPMGPARREIIRSNEVKINVLPLPEEGKPASFYGVVGDFTLAAGAAPTDVAVGDPLEVKLMIEGVGNFDAINAPLMTKPEGWRGYPAKRYNVDGPQDPNQISSYLPPGSPRRIGFMQIFVPERQLTEIPPFELSYFSPTQKRYITVSTQPLPVNVKPGTAAALEGPGTASAASGPASAVPKPPPVLQPKPELSDILVRVPAQPSWRSAVPQASLLANTRFWAAQGVPVAALALALMTAMLRKRRAEQTTGLRGELRSLWGTLEQRGLDDRTFLQRAAYFIQRSHEGGEVKDAELKLILDRYEQVSFQAGTQAPALTTKERRNILTALRPLMQVAVITLLFAASILPAQAADRDAAQKLYDQAREHLENGEFTKAQYFAENILRQDAPLLSADVFNIIGHARFRQNDMGRAALWYQRAALLDPLNPELRQNLRLLDEKLRFFVVPQPSTLGQWSLLLPKDTWVLIATAGAWLVLLALAWRVLIGRASAQNARPRLLVVLLVLLGVGLCLPSAALATLRPAAPSRVHDVIVITAPETSLYAAATLTSAAQLDLPPGSQARLIQQHETWSYIEVAGGDEPLRGWVESSAWQKLWIWDEAALP